MDPIERMKMLKILKSIAEDLEPTSESIAWSYVQSSIDILEASAARSNNRVIDLAERRLAFIENLAKITQAKWDVDPDKVFDCHTPFGALDYRLSTANFIELPATPDPKARVLLSEWFKGEALALADEHHDSFRDLDRLRWTVGGKFRAYKHAGSYVAVLKKLYPENPIWSTSP